MDLVHTDRRYNYFIGDRWGKRPFYNVKDNVIKECNSGYYDISYLEKTKGIKFPSQFKR